MLNVNERIGKIKTVGVRLRPNSPQLKEYFLDLKLYLDSLGIDTLIGKECAQMIALDSLGVDEYTLYSHSDFLVSIGGDGTLIALARHSFKYDKPILGVNMGTLGFLTDVQSCDIKNAIHRILKHDYRLDKRMIIRINAELDGKKHVLHAINDLVIRHKKMRMIHVELIVDGTLANIYFGDALIVATPTGATGYNLSAGGPIVYPYAKNFIFTPICPHSLNQRSLVLPTHFDVELRIQEKEGVLIIDGQDMMDISMRDRVMVAISDSFVKMIHRPERNFFSAIRAKLNWGELNSQ
ncbi:MAG: NAD(+)/NADH kinase [Helicobacteraceae bacterium]|jgi:NAD+ kinase|nr:NAD(+)/NADH kinase [Helicobacteraceae bacterium]